jgi:transposase
MKMSEKSRGGVYEQGERTSFGSPEGDRRGPEEQRDGRGRWSAKRKYAAVLRLLRGEDLETLSRELGVTAATLSGWREQFLEGGAANLKAREADVDNEETQRLKSLVADLSMSNELLREKIHRMEAGRPLVWRRPKP